MPSSEQERQCVQAICHHLKRTLGVDWEVDRWLDDEYPDQRSPDVLLTDGSNNIAIEIKRLTDGDTFQEYEEAQQSLYKGLAPDRGRSFALVPPPSIRLPLTRALVRKLRARVAAAASGLDIGETATVSVPRQATVRYFPRSDGGIIHCSHARSDEFLAVSREVSGAYFVEEDDGPDHQFLSEESRTQFRQILIKACLRSQQVGHAQMKWCEDWALQRGQDPIEGEGGVHVIAATADFLESAAIRSVEKAVCAAKKKFGAAEWAGRTAVALHAGEQQRELSPLLLEAAIDRLEASDVEPLDSVFFVSGTDVREFDFTG